MEEVNNSLAQFLYHLQRTKRSFYALVSLLLLSLLAYNSATIFYTHVPFPAKIPLERASFSPETVPGKSKKFFSVPSSTKLSSSALYAVKEESPVGKLKTHFPLLIKNTNLVAFMNTSVVYHPKRRKKHRRGFKSHESQVKVKPFSVRVKEFFNAHPLNSSCKFRFFMTWISSLESFGDRELFTIESLFKAHPNGCLIIVSSSMDSTSGMQILWPFLDKGFKVNAISPDFNYLFNNTAAQAWYNQLMQGNVNPGEVSLGQNLSNLLRLGLLYRFGGIYLDTDIIVLKSFKKLRNTIGAQTIDPETRNWSRLNNAVMIFDQGHPLLYKFIEEFALTFDGNKWGHNGPYLVSRVVSRISGRPGYNFTVFPPMAFYPVYWSRVDSLFQGPRNETHSKWLIAKLRRIRSQSFTVHLWNKQSRGFKVEEGSIIEQIMFDSCIFCKSSSFASL
ncbi:alpha 1 [Abeliophyllum distichum]|uniref:Alpha 1 n=1 Tax=Abeliophyllum distichum TaxID=126358 RepID=A0ABD1QGR3_9LAMI